MHVCMYEYRFICLCVCRAVSMFVCLSYHCEGRAPVRHHS